MLSSRAFPLDLPPAARRNDVDDDDVDDDVLSTNVTELLKILSWLSLNVRE